MSTSAGFDFYEIVRIGKSNSAELSEIVGQEGAVLGRSYDEIEKQWWYAIFVMKHQECWHVPEQSLERTGRFSKREEFYDGSSIRVSVDPETGEGRIVD